MNEYYNTRYNLSKYFLNIDNDDYYLSILILILYLITFLLSLFALILMLNINGYTIIYIILLVFYYIIVYKLIISLTSISNNETLIKYKKFYEFINIIFKENLKYALNSYKHDVNIISDADIKYLYSIKKRVLTNINNIENIYGKDAEKIFNSSYDLLKYFDLDEYINKGFNNKLYVENINFIQKNLPYIIINPYNKNIKYIDLELLEDYENQKSQLINYLNIKYNKNLSYSSKNILTPDFYKKITKLISNYKMNIYYYIAISIFFIIILLHSLFIYFNYVLTYIYIIAIILSLIILYYFN
jgi:hypothetical protein